MQRDHISFLLTRMIPAMKQGFSIQTRQSSGIYTVDPGKPYVREFIAAMQRDLSEQARQKSSTAGQTIF